MLRRFFFIFFLLALTLNVLANQSDYPPITPDNVMNLREIESLGKGQTNSVLAWSPGSNHVLIGASRGIYLYEDLNAEAEFIELGFSVGNVLYGSDNLVFLQNWEKLLAYDLETRTIRYELDGMRPLAISNNGLMLAYEMDMGVGIVEIATGELLYEMDYTGILDSEDTLIDEEYEIYNENVFIFAQFYPDDSGLVVRWNNHIIFGGSEAGTGFWKFEPRSYYEVDELYSDIPLPAYTFAAFDANGRAFYYVGGTIYYLEQQFDLELSERTWIGRDDGGGSFAAVHGNFLALSLLRGDERGGIDSSKIIVDVTSGEIIYSFQASGHVAFSPDGSKIAIGTAIYSLETGEFLGFLQVARYEVLPNAADRILFSSHDNKRYLLDALSLQVIAEMPSFGRYEQALNKLVFLDSMGYHAQVYDTQTGELLSSFDGEWQDFSFVSFSHNGQYMFSERRVREVFNLNTGESIPIPEGIRALSPYFHPNGTLIAWRNAPQPEFLLYNFETGELEASFPLENPEYPFRMFSPDGRYLVLGNLDSVDVWDVESQTISHHIMPQRITMAISPDSRYLVYLQDIHSIIVFDLLENQEIHRIQTRITYTHLHFMDNEYLYVSGDFGDAATTFSVISGLETPIPYNGIRFAEVNNLVFFREWQAIRIEDNQSTVLHRIQLDPSLTIASLSSDASRLYINYSDGTVGIWAVGE